MINMSQSAREKLDSYCKNTMWSYSAKGKFFIWTCARVNTTLWLVRSEHAHASYAGLALLPPGFNPFGAGKPVFKDWTKPCDW